MGCDIAIGMAGQSRLARPPQTGQGKRPVIVSERVNVHADADPGKQGRSGHRG
jgi:hypothetical protein